MTVCIHCLFTPFFGCPVRVNLPPLSFTLQSFVFLLHWRKLKSDDAGAKVSVWENGGHGPGWEWVIKDVSQKDT